jgi:serine phosphatase RsbU (regulator of sigma subunit)
MVLGVLEVQGGRGEEDRALLASAAERAAVAIGPAQVHERERAIPEARPRALRPDRLPEVDGLELAARFLPGAQVEVGGDWYDALPLAAGGLAVAIGDVAGKGVRAAALMGEIRSGLRAYALDGGEPHEILARLDAFVSRSQRMATVLLALVDPGTGAVRFASAGHLPPLVVHPDGRAELVAGGRAAPLLVYRPAEPAGFDLPAGGCLALYTDGLVERRGEPIDAGLERLRVAAEGHRGGAADLCDRLLRAMHDGDGARDDTAIIAIHRL